jgi:hypothetical protein
LILLFTHHFKTTNLHIDFGKIEKLLHIIKIFKLWNGKGTKGMWAIKDNSKKLQLKACAW